MTLQATTALGVAIVDDEPLDRSGVRWRFAAPDVALPDVQMPDGSGVEAIGLPA